MQSLYPAFLISRITCWTPGLRILATEEKFVNITTGKAAREVSTTLPGQLTNLGFTFIRDKNSFLHSFQTGS